MDLDQVKRELRTYDGPPMRIMEICGSHTAAVAGFGIPSLLSDKLTLLSGPGCPVCVATTAYIDRLITLAEEGNTIVTFGDLIRVPGSEKSLDQAVAEGCRVEMVYSPMDVLTLAESEPKKRFVFAAVGFETTAPVYAVLMEELTERRIHNTRLLTAMKTMPSVVEKLMGEEAPVDGFLAPGHVSVVTGARAFEPIAKKYGIPFAVAGFSGRELLMALHSLIRNRGRGVVENCYPSVVTWEGNTKAVEQVRKYFAVSDATWRGMGTIPGSGLMLREEYRSYDAGSDGLDMDEKKNPACRCDQVLTGRIRPNECPMYGKVCTPADPQGACMVSEEGSCHSYFVNKRKD